MTARPVLLMIAGPNGSGKTELTKQLIADGVELGTYINPDDIAASLEGSYVERVAEAQRIAERLRQECIDRDESFSFETVMSHESKIEILKQARQRGYIVILYFVGTESPELNIDRVRLRVAQGGHDVPTDRIVSRYARSMALLPLAIDQSDRAVIFDNSYRPVDDLDVKMTPALDIRIFRGDSAPTRVEVDWGVKKSQLPGWIRRALRSGWPLLQE